MGLSLRNIIEAAIGVVVMLIIIAVIIYPIRGEVDDIPTIFRKLIGLPTDDTNSPIQKFTVERGFGRDVIIEWVLVNDEKLDFDLYYNDTSGIKEPIDLSGKKENQGIHRLEYELPTYRDHTITLKVTEDGMGEIDYDKKLVTFIQGMDFTTFTVFTGLIDNYIGYNLLIAGDKEKIFPHFWLHKDHMIVAFNGEDTKRLLCGFGSSKVLMPPECAGKNCLCLCGGIGKKDCQKVSLCQEFDVKLIYSHDIFTTEKNRLQRGESLDYEIHTGNPADSKPIGTVLMGRCAVGKNWNEIPKGLRVAQQPASIKMKGSPETADGNVIFINIE